MARVVEPTDSADSEQGGSGAGAAAAEVASASEQVATAQVADALAASEMSDGAGPAEAPAMAGASALGGPRVKVYQLVEDKWVDHKTGFVRYTTGLGPTGSDFEFKVYCETTGSVSAFSSTVRCSKFSKQKDALVCWTEPEAYRAADDKDGEWALSFQRDVDCIKMWEMICLAKGVPPDVMDIDGDTSDDELSALEISMASTLSDSDARYELELNSNFDVKELPAPDIAHLKELADEIYELGVKKVELVTKGDRDTLKSTVFYAYEKYGEQMEAKNFIVELISTFNCCEDLEDIDSLHHIYRLAHGIFVMCNTSLFEILLDGDNILNVIGMFEYPPPELARGTPRKHREYLTQRAGLKEAVPLEGDDMRNQIHLSFRLQYIRDVIFAGVLDDYLHSTLNSYLLFINSEVCQKLSENTEFLNELFVGLEQTHGVTLNGYADRVRLLKELCSFGRNLAQVSRAELFAKLKERGVFQLVVGWLGHRSHTIRQLAVDILNLYNQTEAGVLRSIMISECGNDLFKALAEAFAAETVASLLPQFMSVIRSVVDTSTVEQISPADKTKLLTAFYEHAMATLLQPLDWQLSDDARTQHRHEQVNHALSLLEFVVPMHTYHIKNFVLRNPVLQRTAKQLQSQSVVIECAAVRVLRAVVGLRNEFYNRHIIKHDLFAPVVERLLNTGDRYNMLNSCILEMLDFIRKENIKSLVAYLAETHAVSLKNVTYVNTASDLLTRHEQNNEVLALEASFILPGAVGMGHAAGAPSPARTRRDDTMDDEEESYWDKEDEMDVTPNPLLVPDAAGGAGPAAAEPAAASEDSELPPRPVFRKRLVNYDDDDEEDALFALAKNKQQKVGQAAAVT